MPSAVVPRGHPLRETALHVLIAGVYFLAGKVGIALATSYASASPVWPATGISIAAFLLLGPRVWPAILLGAFLVNVTPDPSVPSALAVGLGNTLEGLVAAHLVRRFAGGTAAFLRPSTVFRFALLAGVLSTTISATIGVTFLGLGGSVAWASYSDAWLTWWLGDLCGALVVAPAIVTSVRAARRRWTRRELVEAGLLLLALVAAAEIAFGFLSPTRRPAYPLQTLCIPPLVWAAFRFGPRETALAGVLLSAIAIGATIAGSGPFVQPSPNESLLLLQAFLSVTTLMALAVAASVQEHRAAEERIQGLNERLEQLVLERTQELQAANLELSAEVDERRRAEAELKTSEGRLKEAQRIARLGSWEWDVVRNRVVCSEEMYQVLGVDPERFAGGNEGFLELVHPEDRAMVEGEVKRALREHGAYAFEYRVLHADGTERSIASHGQVVLDAQGRPQAMIGTGQDITERKRAEAEREQLVREQTARQQAGEANRLKDEFLAVLSHELRTPLSAILSWAILLKDGGLDAATTDRALETIVRNAKIQSQLISDVLDVSRIVSGRLTLELQAVELGPLVGEALSTLQPALDARGVSVHVSIDPRAKPVLGDPARLQQVVWNLVSNAIKFAPPVGGRVDVCVGVRGDRGELTVSDNGPGIDPDFLPHAFDRFRQADSSTTRQHGGLGLGLAIVRHMVELHGGSVQAENLSGASAGTGAVFTVLLPLAAEERAAPAWDPARAEALPSVSLPGVRVLAVDDEPDGREVVRELLERWGARVFTAGSAAEALREFEEHAPDLVLTDIGMAHEDGFSLLRRLRALPSARGGRLPVVALTAYASAEDRRRALAAGFDAHLTKPLQPAELARTLLALARRRPGLAPAYFCGRAAASGWSRSRAIAPATMPELSDSLFEITATESRASG